MLMRVTERDNEVEIHFSGLGGRQHAVLAVISGSDGNEAAIDRAKLASVSVRARSDAMNVRLRAKDGEAFDVSQLYRCLRRSLMERHLQPLDVAAA
jgi:hypothetical protein